MRMLQIIAYGFVSTRELSPSLGIRIAGPELFDTQSMRSIAAFNHDTWGNGAEGFSRIEILGPLQLWCIDGDVELLVGRFELLMFEGELLHTTTATLARLVRDEWELPSTGTHWPELMIESVPADPFASGSGS
jgi:hypothetical protein